MGDGENLTNWKFGKLNQQIICVSSSPSVDEISVSAIMKKWKNGHNFVNIDCMENVQITDPSPQSLGLWFSKCWWKWNISVSQYEKIEKWPLFCKY